MSKYLEIEDTNNPGSYYTILDGTCEYVNPIYHFYLSFIEMRIRYIKAMSDKSLTYAEEKYLENKISSDWQDYKKEILNHKLPTEFLTIFGVTRKKELIKILRGSKLTLEDFQAFIFQAWETFGFKFSKYVFVHDPVEFQTMEKPTVTFKKSKNDIRKVGATDMSDRQLNALIDKRNVVVANIFDKENEWHCLFLTHKGIAGKELDHISIPHMHYISSAFGITRSDLIKEFNQTRYSLDSIHIPFIGFNPMTDEEIIKNASF